MDEAFKCWIIGQLEHDSDLRHNLLTVLKFTPRSAQEMIHDLMRTWGENYHKSVVISLDRDPREVMQVMREHFADELSTIALAKITQ